MPNNIQSKLIPYPSFLRIEHSRTLPNGASHIRKSGLDSVLNVLEDICVELLCSSSIWHQDPLNRKRVDAYSPDVTLGQRLTDGRGRAIMSNCLLCDLEPQGMENLGESPNGRHVQIIYSS